jgi:septal ring factor EnvC (AmiA/AmiB activator)
MAADPIAAVPAESSGSESDDSESEDDIILLEEKPSDWVEPPAKRRKLSVSTTRTLEDEIRDLETHLQKTEELRVRAEFACKDIQDQLERLRARLAV